MFTLAMLLSVFPVIASQYPDQDFTEIVEADAGKGGSGGGNALGLQIHNIQKSLGRNGKNIRPTLFHFLEISSLFKPGGVFVKAASNCSWRERIFNS